MQRKLTLTIDEDVYYGLYRTVAKRRISKFIEELIRPHVTDMSLDEDYAAMANDKDREAEAAVWCESLGGEVDETR
ncbi:MAG: addiction module antitoxin [Synergistaceae bacterium]|nr:addiction module antitoxin [Synergistaceae bacterium]